MELISAEDVRNIVGMLYMIYMSTISLKMILIRIKKWLSDDS